MKAWKYQLDNDYQYTSDLLTGVEFDNKWVTIKESTITIRAGYAWDGCSPKITFLGLLNFGTPDGILYLGKPWLYYPSLIHDVLCQFKNEIPVSKSLVVCLWHETLVTWKWPLTKLYTWAVDKFGPQDFKY